MSKDMTLLDQVMESEEPYLELGWKNYKGEIESGEPDFAKAAEYFEKARKADVTKESEVLLPLARAYRESGKSIQAIHWLKHAISEYGMIEAEAELMELYKTGIAGKELKEKADKYIAEIEKTKKEQEVKAMFEQYEANKIEYPENFLANLNYMFAYEKTYIDFLKNTKPLRVPELKKGLFGGNKKEVERIQKQNEEYEEMRKSEAEFYEQQKEDLLKEKEELGIKEKLFFEYPLVTENARDCVRAFRKDLNSKGNSKNHSLYSFGNEQALQFYLFDEGYDTFDDIHATYLAAAKEFFHASSTFGAGELLLFMADRQGKLINKEHPDGEGLQLYHSTNNVFGSRWAKLSYLKPFLSDPRFMVLHWDWEYFQAHPEEKYSLNYLWDYDYACVDNYSHSVSAEESLENYYKAAKDLTDLYTGMEENYHGSIREYFTDNALQNINASDNGDPYDERYMKKALLVTASARLVAVIIPKKEADVIVLHGKLRRVNLDVNQNSSVLYSELESITLEKGTAWEYYVGTTIHHIAIHMAKRMKPVDGTEVKPAGLPDKLWRFWLRARYANQDN